MAYDELTLVARRLAELLREERRDAINYARASVELEGFHLSEAALEQGQRFINGEISLAEFVTS
jgi:hypothetical protein